MARDVQIPSTSDAVENMESSSYSRRGKKIPIRVQKILPAVMVIGLTGILSSCAGSASRAALLKVEAASTRDPVVAPAGTVLRVRLNQALASQYSRPGDRFSGVLVAPIVVGRAEILAKGTVVEGHVQTAEESAEDGRSALGLTLDCYLRDGRRYALTTQAVTRAGSKQITVMADSIVGFTTTCVLVV